MTFEEAQDRVKIGHFTRKGYKIRGVVHVGANDGFEIQFYLASEPNWLLPSNRLRLPLARCLRLRRRPACEDFYLCSRRSG